MKELNPGLTLFSLKRNTGYQRIKMSLLFFKNSDTHCRRVNLNLQNFFHNLKIPFLTAMFFLTISLHPNTDEVLLYAAEKGDLSQVKTALNWDGDVNASDKNGATVLIKACENGHRAIVDLVLKRGAEVNARDKTGATALIYASIVGDKKIVELLIKYGADVNIKDSGGKSPLSEATQFQNKEIIELLKAAGAK